jgi:transcriptional regulator with XRE-family HTH domain
MLLMNDRQETDRKFERPYRADRVALRKLRGKAKLTLKGLAAKSGINYTTISRIEKGHNLSPHWSTLEPLAEALEVDVEEIVVFYELKDVPDEPGPTEENLRHVEEIRQERRQLREADRESSHESGGRTP